MFCSVIFALWFYLDIFCLIILALLCFSTCSMFFALCFALCLLLCVFAPFVCLCLYLLNVVLLVSVFVPCPVSLSCSFVSACYALHPVFLFVMDAQM